jgi:hypothetical protein
VALGVAEGDADEAVAVAAEWLAGDCVTVAVVHPAAARAANEAAARIFLILLSSPLPGRDDYMTLRTP